MWPRVEGCTQRPFASSAIPQLDEKLPILRHGHEKEVHSRLICARANLRINRLELKALVENFRGPQDVPHIALDLLNAFAEARQKFRYGTFRPRRAWRHHIQADAMSKTQFKFEYVLIGRNFRQWRLPETRPNGFKCRRLNGQAHREQIFPPGASARNSGSANHFRSTGSALAQPSRNSA